MSELARTYQPRAYRYTLRPQENRLIRFAGPNRTPWEEGTEITNLSVTGLAFTTPEELCPLIGETIRVEFIVPSDTQMACFAKVIRVVRASSETQLVGIRFAHLTPAHHFVLRRGISTVAKKRFRRQRMERLGQVINQLRMRWPLLLVWLLSTGLLALSFFALLLS